MASTHTKALPVLRQHICEAVQVDVFERFVRDFEGKINQFKFVEMGVKVSKDIDSTFSLSSLLPYIQTNADRDTKST